VHDQVVVAAGDLEIVMGGHRIMEQTSQMSPRYAKGMRQLQSFGKELHKRLELGVRRLSRLKEVTVKHYVS